MDAELGTLGRDRRFVGVREGGEPPVAEPKAFSPAQGVHVARQSVRADLRLGPDDHLDLAQEPGIDGARPVDRLDGNAAPEGFCDHEQAIGPGLAERGEDRLVVAFFGAGNVDLVEAGEPGLHGAQRLLQRFAEGAPIAMASPTDFIEVVSRGSAPGNFSNAKRGTLSPRSRWRARRRRA